MSRLSNFSKNLLQLVIDAQTRCHDEPFSISS
jgi:hypothetical protein